MVTGRSSVLVNDPGIPVAGKTLVPPVCSSLSPTPRCDPSAPSQSFRCIQKIAFQEAEGPQTSGDTCLSQGTKFATSPSFPRALPGKGQLSVVLAQALGASEPMAVLPGREVSRAMGQQPVHVRPSPHLVTEMQGGTREGSGPSRGDPKKGSQDLITGPSQPFWRAQEGKGECG